MTITPSYALIFLITFFPFGQSQAQTDCDYLNQSFDILQQAIYDELVADEQEWDSAHVLFDGYILMCVTKDSSDFRLLSSDFSIKQRNNSRVVAVSTECVKASYAYSLFGKLKSIRFKYSVGMPLFEGTWSNVLFVREADRLAFAGENPPDGIFFSIKYFD